MIAGNLAILAAGVFAGAAIYVSLVEHPARMTLDAAVAVAQWRPSYRRATVMQASLAVAGTVLALLAWRQSAVRAWLYGALCLCAVVPFTVLVMFPINGALENENLNASNEEVKALLDRWAWLHAVRSVLGLLAFALMLSARL